MAGIGHRGFMGRKKEPVGLPFIFSVTVGSGQSFQLPTINSGTYDAIIDWGDGGSDVLTVWGASSRNHTYTVGGTYDITISGLFNGWSVNNYADRLKITEIKQWGNLKFGTGARAFYGCENLIISATDAPNTSECTNFEYFWANCSSVTVVPTLNDWDFSNVTSLFRYLNGATNFNQYFGDVDVSSVITMSFMLLSANSYNQPFTNWVTSSLEDLSFFLQQNPSFNQPLTFNTSNVTNWTRFAWANNTFNQDISNLDFSSGTIFTEAFRGSRVQGVGDFNISSIISASSMLQNFGSASVVPFSLDGWGIATMQNGNDFLSGRSMSTANYDATLISWAAQAPSNAVSIHFGGSKYTSGGAAEAARTALISTYGWTIIDGGAA